jgi:hypothetical protein
LWLASENAGQDRGHALRREDHRVRVGTAGLFAKGTFFLMACNDAVAPAVFVYAAPRQLAIM